MSEEFEARAGAPQQPPQEGAEEQEKLPQEELFYWLQTLVTAIVCIVLVFTFLGRITRVVGHSMDDTLADGELLAVWSLGYEPEQGDIVVLNKTTADFLEGEAIVKRVIALEGQTVDIDYDAGTVAVDGQVLDEPYILEEMLWPSSSHMQETHFEVPEDSIFVMGDNRNGSTDSRHEWLGAIDEDYILGQAVAVLWPLGRSARSAYFPTQKRWKIRSVMSSRTEAPVSSPRAERASSTSVSRASGVTPADSPAWAPSSRSSAREAASSWRALESSSP